MKLRIITLFLVSLGFSSLALAGKPYIGPSLYLQQISANHSSFRGLHPKMTVGYSAMFCKLYWAGEIFLDPFTLVLSDNKNPGASSTRTSVNYGFSLIPGLRIVEGVLGYGRIGLVSTKFSSTDNWKVGAQLGVGVQTGLTANWVARLDYINTIYGPVHQIGTPNSNELGVGLLYYFDKM